MSIKRGVGRDELQSFSLEKLISEDNEVRVIDVFVNSLDLIKLGFVAKGQELEGSSAYGNDRLLKLYLYGYQNKLRSSRDLEKACTRNVELWWLLDGLRPCYKTIADFRKDNAVALEGVFQEFNRFLQQCDLYGRQTFGTDSMMIRAQNSKKNNFSQKKIDRHKAYIAHKKEDYLALLSQTDAEESRQAIEEQLREQDQRLAKYQALEAELVQSGQTQICTVDPAARMMTKNGGQAEVVYNIQAVVDGKNCLISHFEATNESDQNKLSQNLLAAKEALGLTKEDSINGLADKGYFKGQEIQRCTDENIRTYVAEKGLAQQKEPGFNKMDFVYLSQQDAYVCPQGEFLLTNGKWHIKNKGKQTQYRYQVYKLSFDRCGQCPLRKKCISAARLADHRGRYLERLEFEAALAQNHERLQANPEIYRRRQAIVEHPFGTIKRQWGYSYTLLKGIPKVSGEFALIFTCYNLRRAISILGVKELLRRLNEPFFVFFRALWAMLNQSAQIFQQNCNALFQIAAIRPQPTTLLQKIKCAQP